MTSQEIGGMTPEEAIQAIKTSADPKPENKYAFQVGLKDLDFQINDDILDQIGTTVPFQSIYQAEQALEAGAIQPTAFIEFDETSHQVQAFDPRPVGFSGFMDCVTHSLALTDHGLFEVGRYPAVRMSGPSRTWQWFIHRQLAESQQVKEWMDQQGLTPGQLLEKAYQAIINR